MPSCAIREIIRLPALTGVPLMPDFLRGVINVRGTVLPVMDLSLRLGLAATVFTKRTCVAILELPRGRRDGTIGVLVDAVHTVLSLDASHIQALTPVHPRIRSEFILGTVAQDGGMTVLDSQTVFDLEALAAAIGRPSAERFSLAPAEAARGAP